MHSPRRRQGGHRAKGKLRHTRPTPPPQTPRLPQQGNVTPKPSQSPTKGTKLQREDRLTTPYSIPLLSFRSAAQESASEPAINSRPAHSEARPVVIPQRSAGICIRTSHTLKESAPFFVVIPEGNLRFQPSAWLSFPKGSAFPPSFWLSFPKGICVSSRQPGCHSRRESAFPAVSASGTPRAGSQYAPQRQSLYRPHCC